MIKLMDIYSVDGSINKKEQGSFVHIVSWSHTQEMYVVSDIIYMGTHYDLLHKPIAEDVMAGSEDAIIVTDEIGDFFKVETTFYMEKPIVNSQEVGDSVLYNINKVDRMNYKQYNIPDSAYIAFVGAAITVL